MAAFYSKTALAKILLEFGGDPNGCSIQETYGISILHRAVISDNNRIVKMLLDNGADLNIRNKRG